MRLCSFVIGALARKNVRERAGFRAFQGDSCLVSGHFRRLPPGEFRSTRNLRFASRWPFPLRQQAGNSRQPARPQYETLRKLCACLLSTPALCLWLADFPTDGPSRPTVLRANQPDRMRGQPALPRLQASHGSGLLAAPVSSARLARDVRSRVGPKPRTGLLAGLLDGQGCWTERVARRPGRQPGWL